MSECQAVLQEDDLRISFHERLIIMFLSHYMVLRFALFIAVILSLMAGGIAAAGGDEGAAPAFCPAVRAATQAVCTARYDCSVAADDIDRLRRAACDCLRGDEPPADTAADLLARLERTPAFACCAGNALARDPGICAAG